MPDRTGLRLAMTLALGALGGAFFAWRDLPLAWMLGALAATTVGSVAGLRLGVPDRLRRPMIAAIGVMLGTSFTPERLAGALAWLPSLGALPVYIVAVGALILWYLRRCSSFDPTTAFFAGAPGGLSEMIALSEQLGGDQRSVSLVHATRLLLIVFTVPFLARLLGPEVGAAPAAAAPEVDLADLGLMIALGALGYALAHRLRLPAATFVGPLLGSLGATLAGWIDSQPPFVLLAIAQLVIGSSVGARFSAVPVAAILRTLLLGAGATALMLLVTLAFGSALHAATGIPLALLLLAFIPGGLPEMSLIALAIGVDPAFVVTHHAFRVFLVVLIALPAYHLLARAGRLGFGGGDGPP